MGFWDFIAPDYGGFRAAMEPVTPATVSAGSWELSRDQVIDLAWLNPASLAGIAARLFYQGGGVQAQSQSSCSSLIQAQLDNLVRGGSNPLGPAVAGSDLTAGVTVPQIVIANTYRVTMRAVFGGQAIENVYHFTGSAPGQEQACATQFQAAFKNVAGPIRLWDNKFTLVEFEAVDLSSINGGIWVINDTTAGTRTAAECSGRQVCALITYNGQTRNRSSRGRLYHGPLYEGDIATDGATLNTTPQGLISTSYSNLRNLMISNGFQPCVLSRVLVQTFAITQARVENTIATQRRRLR